MIRDLREDELAAAGALAAAAFREDPGFSYILPDDAGRRLRLPSLLAALFAVDAAAGGRVRGAFDGDAFVGVSAVIPEGAESPDLVRWIRHLPSLGWLLWDPPALLRGAALGRAVEELRPADRAYLHVLAVHPATQGRGIGAALLKDALEASGGRLYLETFTKDNVNWYERLGFKTTGEVLSASRPPFWTMRRG
ncbi:MAG: GNAT family N-acetyltransferase [Elusimicrobiota bacterium]|nr:MAG: GNAT family N-acetyltransferase [Elusimicrobiota bacterium]